MTPKINEFILVLLDERVTELEKELEQEVAKQEAEAGKQKAGVKH